MYNPADFFEIKENVIFIKDEWTKNNIPIFYDEIFNEIVGKLVTSYKLQVTSYKSRGRINPSRLFGTQNCVPYRIDGSGLLSIDSSGVAFLDEILELLNINTDSLINFSDDNLNKFNIFTSVNKTNETTSQKENFFVSLGYNIYKFFDNTYEMLLLTSEIFYWSLVGLWNQKGKKKGTFTQQCILLGLNALPIVGLLSFIIGLILSMQSAVQLRQLGGDGFLPHLLSVALVGELSPLIVAIIVAGRSGSSIASEIATMKVTEELDALKMMALSPIRYIVVPKFHAISVCMILLVLFSILVGIMGGLFIAVTVLGHSPIAFLNACVDVVLMRTFLITLIKSTVFAWQIVIIGSFYGFRVRGGAEGVGQATTLSVVASIFGVIIMDAIFSLYYVF